MHTSGGKRCLNCILNSHPWPCYLRRGAEQEDQLAVLDSLMDRGRAHGADFLPACHHSDTSLGAGRRPASSHARPPVRRCPACRLRHRWWAAEPRLHAGCAGAQRTHLCVTSPTQCAAVCRRVAPCPSSCSQCNTQVLVGGRQDAGMPGACARATAGAGLSRESLGRCSGTHRRPRCASHPAGGQSSIA